MTSYVPRFETQRDESAPAPWTNCTPASAAMLVDLWTYGRIDTSDVALRRASPIPLDQGMNFAAVGLAIKALYPALGDLRYSEKVGFCTAPMSWAQLRTHLASGGGAVACGNYNSWGDWRARSGLLIRRWQLAGTFGHAVFVCDYRTADGSVLLMDPLGHGDYAGDRIPLEALWAFIWRSGSADDSVRVTAAHSFTVARPARPTVTLPPADLAGALSAFGTRYPSYVHTAADALAWVNRNLRLMIADGRLEL